MDLENDYRFQVAIDLVKTGLQSGSIKLYGVGQNTSFPAEHGTADATYLIALLQGLVKELPTA